MKTRGAPIQPATKLPLEVFAKWTLRGERYCRELLADTLAGRARRFELSTPVWMDICRELAAGGLDTREKVTAAADRVITLHRKRNAALNARDPLPLDLSGAPFGDFDISTLADGLADFDISDLIPDGDPLRAPQAEL